MELQATTWTKEEFQAYLLLYCASADMNISDEEKKIIKSKLCIEKFDAICKEFNNDNDFECIQKIIKTTERLNFNSMEKEELFKEIKELFFTDGDYSELERNLEIGLMRILK